MVKSLSFENSSIMILFPFGERAVEVLKRVIENRKKGYVFINPRSRTSYKSTQTSFNKGIMGNRGKKIVPTRGKLKLSDTN